MGSSRPKILYHCATWEIPFSHLLLGSPDGMKPVGKEQCPPPTRASGHSILGVWHVPQACPLALLGLFALGFGCVDNQR